MLKARLVRRHGVVFWTVPAWERRGCRAAFFWRTGGVSAGAYAELNLGLSCGDRRAAVLENRVRALAAAGMGPLAPTIGRQVHGTRLRRVSRPDAGRGWHQLRTAWAGTDGLLTSVRGLPICVSVADCLPVLLCDAAGRAVGAVHAGWRGIVRGILPAVVRRFREIWGIGPASLSAAIGPSIGPQAFRVEGEALEQLRGVDPDAVQERPGGCYFDLWQAACGQLRQAGVPERQILALRECTHSHPDRYFSHRRDRQTGRMLAIIQKV